MTDTPSPDAPTEPSKEALRTARAVAALIDIEHDDTMQADCRFCQQAIPRIALALDRFRAAGVRDTVGRGLQRLKPVRPDLYDELQRALAGRG